MNDAKLQTPAEADHSQIVSALIGALPDPVLVVDGNRRIIATNSGARILFTNATVGGALTLSVRAPDILDAVLRILDGGERECVLWSEPVPVERLFEVYVSAFTYEGYRAAVIEFRDLTEARRVERMRVDFIANASHELRTPLASLLGFIETLQGPAKDDTAAREQFLGIMRDQARRMTRLVDDLLSLSRIEQNEHVRPQTPVDLVAIVRHVVDTLAPVANEGGVELMVSTPKTAMIAGDRDELIRVAENLVENAIKYGAGGGSPQRVTVSVTESGGLTTLEVRDNGPGIPPEHLPRLTERFYRVDAPTSRAKGGTGLGLAIVKHIVSRHRGRLSVESTLGSGSTFRVTLKK
ncbi:ATP-binding protein [Methylocella sp. CPCC 101449]|jgi:two-component system phosphate regulon sensor histidine kinase PhoR|uniref:ATP-binding protein n=1 Tax=Methylocella sp. CPCC 101449 TaxID=2987531 RepID=UPI0028917B73|nr:ATP-binding protein [Methylocella sp. CPCC 101449]MDT2019919.1 ATP-binding protein [Methylocella sp. CPCC 101449]HEV2575175.1 ATP-binding protein [Beijerinckiaceae bacterium]